MILRGALLGAAGAIVLLAACGSSKLAGPGGECFVATDCQAGLVCIQQKDKSRVCSDDLSRIAGDVPPEASVPDDGSNEGGEGGTPDDGSTPDQPDTSTGSPDTGSPPPPPPKDSGSPADTGADH